MSRWGTVRTHTHTHTFLCRELSHMCDSFMRVTCHIHMWDMPHSYLWHDSFVCVTWLIHMCNMTHLYVWRGSFVCVTWLIHMCGMIPSCVWHDSIISAWYDSPKKYPAKYDASDSACPQQVCALDMVHSFTWDDASKYNTTHPYVTRLLHMRDVTHPYIRWLVHKMSSKVSRIRFCIYVTWLIHMWHDSFTGCPAKCHTFDSAYMWRDSSYVTCLLTWCPAECRASDSAYIWRDPSIRDMTHSQDVQQCVTHQTHREFAHVTHLMHLCDMTPGYATRLIICDVPHTCTGRDSSIRNMTRLQDIQQSVTHQILRVNSEFAHYVPENSQAPVVVLQAYGAPALFPLGVKHKWTRWEVLQYVLQCMVQYVAVASHFWKTQKSSVKLI